MAQKLLITRPNHELVVSYLYAWGEELISLAEQKGFSVSDFKGKLACRDNFEKFVKKQKPELIFLNGHGSATTVCGINDEPLVIAGQNDNILSGSIIHALSCDSSGTLGKSAVEKGAKAYIGYKMPFCILTDTTHESQPGRDNFAKIFKDPALEAPKNLIKKNTVGEAFRRARIKYRDSIRFYSSSDAPPEAEYIRFVLFSNMVALDLQCLDADISI